MTYAEAERLLLSLELFGMRFGLERVRRLLTALGSPQERFTSVHVVGSNGKSSTTRMLAALLDAGAYLSPHLVSFNERVLLRGGREVSREAFGAAVERAHSAAQLVERGLDDDDRVTQFELLTAAAFLLLAGERVAVVEAGLGGRYDATNVLASEVQVLTNVSLEHTRWLGPTITDIAGEKLDVVEPGGTLVVGHGLHPDAAAVAERVCRERGARLVVAPAEPPVEPVAAGAFQRRNFALAVTAARVLRPDLRDEAVHRAAAVTVPGRFELRDGVIFDGAHNAAGMAALTEALDGRRVVAVLSVLDDKDAAEMLRTLLPLCDGVICTSCSNPRALPPGTLQSLVAQLGGRAEVEPEPHAALARARDAAASTGAAPLVTGSLYLLADLLRPAGAREASTL